MTDQPQCIDRTELRSLAFEAFPSQVAVVDRDGVILDTNGCWEGFAVDNGVTLHPDMVGENYLDACDAAAGDESASEAASGIRSILDGERESFRFEYPCHGPDERRWFMMRARRLEDDGDGCVLVIHTDITERREAELAVEARNEQLELLTGVLGHDLRNPMNVALGRAELLDGDDEQVSVIRSSLERMDAIIEDALLLARGTELEKLSTVDLGAVARAAWSYVDTAEATLAVESTGRIEADESLLSQLLENVFRNAVENAGDHVHVVVGQMEETAGFFVADDGPGVPPDRREAVFDPGYTTNSDEGGTGLGLAIVERVAEAHGWTAGVTESETGGARFEFSGVASGN